MSAAQQLLQAARPTVPAVAAPRCQHPTRPAPLRRFSCFDEPCIELLTASTINGNPCCILPCPPAAGGSQPHSLQRLIGLSDLNAATVVDKLAAVEGHVKNACADCPAAAAGGDSPRQPSPLVYRPDFACFLERCLELAQLHKGLGLAPAVLLLQIVSRLDYAADDSLRSSFSRYYLHLQVELEAACELHAEALSPQVALAVVRAWARMGALPMNSPPFGRALRSHIKAGRFTPQELSLLLAALAQQRAARPSYRPCQYDVADVAAQLTGPALQGLAASHLASVARSLGAFPWPVYRLMPALEAVTQEAVRRQAAGEMGPAAASVLLASALDSARAMHPRHGRELEAKLAGWQAAAARPASGNILGFAPAAPGVKA